MDQSLKNLLDRDPVAEAEWLYNGGDRWSSAEGPDHNQNKALEFLQHAFKVNAEKEAALKVRDDTCFSNSLADYQRIISDIGFRKVLTVLFDSTSGRQEQYFIYFRDNGGILLSFDTFGGNVNGGKFYYNWRTKSGEPCWPIGILSSGSRRGDAWAGDHDCREAVRHHIGCLEESGSFVTPWKHRPFLWLLHHMDTKERDLKEIKYDYKAITEERIALLPDDVVKAITPGC